MNRKIIRFVTSIFMAFAIFLVLLMLGCQSEPSKTEQKNADLANAQKTNTPPGLTSSANHQLELISWSYRIQGNVVEATGQIVNVSDKPISAIKATSEFVTDEGKLLSTLQGEVSSIQPNETETFKLIGKFNSPPTSGKRVYLMSPDSLRFKTKNDEVIEYTDKSKAALPN